MIFNTVKAHFRAVEAEAGIAGAQLWALSVIHARPGIGVGQVASAMDIHQSTASNLLRPLIERGLVVAERRLADRRAVHLQVTVEGSRLLRKAPQPFAGVLPQALANLDPKVLDRLERDLADLIRTLSAQDGLDQLPLGQ